MLRKLPASSKFAEENMIERKNIGKESAYAKIRHYCAYQERNHRQVKEKLYSFGLYKSDVEQLIAQLIEENFLNEERYAEAFAGGKFRIKKWGRNRIRYELKLQGVSDYCIRKALASIDEDDYSQTLQNLFAAKKEGLDENLNSFQQRQKIQAYLSQKGYEPDLIQRLFRED